MRSLYYCRGEKFRSDFAHISPRRNTFSSKKQQQKLNVMALMATANVQTCKIIIDSFRLEMKSYHVPARSPNYLYIYYTVQSQPANPILFSDIIGGKVAKRCLCFCKTYDNTPQIYMN